MPMRSSLTEATDAASIIMTLNTSGATSSAETVTLLMMEEAMEAKKKLADQLQ